MDKENHQTVWSAAAPAAGGDAGSLVCKYDPSGALALAGGDAAGRLLVRAIVGLMIFYPQPSASQLLD